MRKLLLVIDYQKDFVDGALGFEKAKTLSEGIRKKIISYRNDGWDIALTMDTHHEDYLKTQEGRILPIVHCIDQTEGHQIYDGIRDVIHEGDKVFKKPTFGSIALGNYLKEKNYDAIELVGLVTNMCVISNAVIAKAALPEAEIIIDSRLVASFSDELHQKALDVMKGLQMTILS